jgi:hypothetical protein
MKLIIFFLISGTVEWKFSFFTATRQPHKRQGLLNPLSSGLVGDPRQNLPPYPKLYSVLLYSRTYVVDTRINLDLPSICRKNIPNSIPRAAGPINRGLKLLAAGEISVFLFALCYNQVMNLFC